MQNLQSDSESSEETQKSVEKEMDVYQPTMTMIGNFKL